MKWISKVLKWPVLYLWDEYELDPALALALFLLLAVVTAPLLYVSPCFLICPVTIFGYVLLVVIWAIIEGISDES